MAAPKDTLRSRVESIQNLPTLAKIALRVIDLASRPDVSMSELSDVIHEDPSLAARILRVANSPFYGMPRQVDSIRLALVLLGLTEVRNIALGLSVFNIVRSMNSHVTYKREEFWFHSAGCAMVSKIIARKVGMRNEGTDFAAGLLHDMGKIALDEYFGPEFDRICSKAKADGTSLFAAEQAVLGGSHADVGEWLAGKWRLPEALCNAIAHHHDWPRRAPLLNLKDPKLASIIFLAEAFCHKYGIGWDGDADCCDLKDARSWNMLLPNGNKLSSNEIDTILTETLQTFAETRRHMCWQ